MATFSNLTCSGPHGLEYTWYFSVAGGHDHCIKHISLKKRKTNDQMKSETSHLLSVLCPK